MKIKNNILCLILIYSLAACGHRSDQLAAGMSSGATLPITTKNNMVTGSVTGGANAFFHSEQINDDDFQEALARSLTNNSLLAADSRSATYKIDADITQDYSGSVFGDKDVQEKIVYKVYNLHDGSLALQKTVVTDATMEGLTVKGLLLEKPAEVNQRWHDAYSNAAKDNLKQFIDALLNWASQKT